MFAVLYKVACNQSQAINQLVGCVPNLTISFAILSSSCWLFPFSSFCFSSYIIFPFILDLFLIFPSAVASNIRLVFLSSLTTTHSNHGILFLLVYYKNRCLLLETVTWCHLIMCSHLFILLWLRKTSVSIEMYRLSFRRYLFYFSVRVYPSYCYFCIYPSYCYFCIIRTSIFSLSMWSLYRLFVIADKLLFSSIDPEIFSYHHAN